MNQTTAEIIQKIDTKLITKLVKDIGTAECEKHSCAKCQLYEKLKEFTEALDESETTLSIIVGLVKPSTLFLIGFITALSYLEIKELEALAEEKPHA